MVEIDVFKFGRVVAKAMVDDQDAYLGEDAYLGNTKWHIHYKGYAYRNSRSCDGRRTPLLHREVMGNPVGKLVDHIDGDRLDCRRKNLRATDKYGNSQNRRGAQKNSKVGVRGVVRLPSGRYQAKVHHRGKGHHVGVFDTVEEAGRAAAAKRDEFGFLRGAESASGGVT